MPKFAFDVKPWGQALISALVGSLLVVLPLGSTTPGIAAPVPSQINFANQICDLTTAGYSGTGTSADPYQISDAPSLWESPDCGGSSKFFKLVNNIDLSVQSSLAADAPTTSPIGFSTSAPASSRQFQGSLDGQGFAISNISISSSTGFSGVVGLFWKLNLSEVKNTSVSGSVVFSGATTNVDVGGLAGYATSITLSGITSYMQVQGHGYVGGLVGNVQNYVTVSAVVTYGDVSATSGVVGGIIGGSSIARVSGSINYGKVDANNDVAGLVGRTTTRAIVLDSKNYGTISASVSGNAGGLVGQASNPSTVDISNSENYGKVGSAGSGIGGLVGWAATNATVSNSINHGQITSNGEGVAGLVGLTINNLLVRDSQNLGEVRSVRVTGNANAGGLAGLTFGNFTVERSTNSASVVATVAQVAGIVGRVEGQSKVTSVQNLGAVSGSNYVGGIIGNAKLHTTLSLTVNRGEIVGTTWVSGLVGNAEAMSEFYEVENFGPVQARGSNVGGVLGGGGNVALIQKATNSGTITGTERIGGLVGASQARISNSLNEADVNATKTTAEVTVGGLVGRLGSGTFSSLISSVNSGNVTAGPNGDRDVAGGLVGQTYEDATISASHNLGSVKGGSKVAGLVGHQRYSKALTINNSYNRGVIQGTTYTAGLIGDAEGTVSVNRAFNDSSVSGTIYVAGLVAQVSSSLVITNSYNVGTISGTSNVAGLIGYAQSGADFTNVYNAGTFSNVASSDSFISRVINPGSVTLLSAYTLFLSTYSSASTLNQMRSANLYSGWDFNQVWGFGTCTENNGLPMLRFAAGVTNYYGPGCYVPPVQNQQAGNQPGYSGPMIFASLVPAKPGSTVILNGEKLSGITSLFIGSTPATFSIVSAVTISVEIAGSLPDGEYDIVVLSPDGKLTVLEALMVGTTPSQKPGLTDKGRALLAKTHLLPRFKNGGTNISKIQTDWLGARLIDTGFTRVTCTALISNSMSLKQKIQVRKQAALACSEAAKILPNVVTNHQSKVTKDSRLVGRVLVGFRG